MNSLNKRMYMHEILAETIDDDLTAHRQASLAYRLIADYVASGRGPEYEIEFSDGRQFYGFDPRSLGFETEFGLRDTVLLIGMVNRKSMVMAGAIMRFNEPLADRFHQ